MSAFAEQFLCTFEWTEADQQRREAALRYVHETEAYDRTVCTGPIGRDGIMPANASERALSIRFSSDLLHTLVVENAHLFTRADLLREISRTDLNGLST